MTMARVSAHAHLEPEDEIAVKTVDLTHNDEPRPTPVIYIGHSLILITAPGQLRRMRDALTTYLDTQRAQP
jgi:hypothetical protein